jgi:hypothetical protein
MNCRGDDSATGDICYEVFIPGRLCILGKGFRTRAKRTLSQSKHSICAYQVSIRIGQRSIDPVTLQSPQVITCSDASAAMRTMSTV